MDASFFLISLLNGLSNGLLLFMLASGLTLIFSMMGVFNIAQGVGRGAAGRAPPGKRPRHRAAHPRSGTGRGAVKGYLLDTCILSELRRPRPESKEVDFVSAQPLESLFVSAATFAEIRFGIELVADVHKRAANCCHGLTSGTSVPSYPPTSRETTVRPWCRAVAAMMRSGWGNVRPAWRPVSTSRRHLNITSSLTGRIRFSNMGRSCRWSQSCRA